MVRVMSANLDDPGVSRRRLLTSFGAATLASAVGVEPARADSVPAPRSAQDLRDLQEPRGPQVPPTPVATGLDYSLAPHPSVGAMTAAGYKFAVRYLSHSPEKNLTADEAQALTRAGIAVVCNWEATADGPRQGYAQGVADATEAQKQAAACGMPADRPIYFSVDWDVQAADMDAVNAYFDGVASVIGVARTGAYSSYDALGWLLAAGRIRWAWQSCSTAFSNGRNRSPYPGIQLWQNRTAFTFDGAEVDGDQALTPDFGQWGVGASGYPQGSGGRIAGGVHDDGRVELFAVTPAGGITNTAETAPNGAWTGWGDFSPAKGFGFAARTSSVATGRHADGRLEVFAVMSDGSVQNCFETSANGAWSRLGRVRAVEDGQGSDGRGARRRPHGAVRGDADRGRLEQVRDDAGWSVVRLERVRAAGQRHRHGERGRSCRRPPGGVRGDERRLDAEPVRDGGEQRRGPRGASTARPGARTGTAFRARSPPECTRTGGSRSSRSRRAAGFGTDSRPRRAPHGRAGATGSGPGARSPLLR